MASKSTLSLRSILSSSRTGSGTRTYATSTSANRFSNINKKALLNGELLPVYVSLGLIVSALGIGYHTIKQQLMHNPSVRVSKKRRESIPEVEEPDYVLDEADNFVKKSFFRKLAHVQEFYRDAPVPDSIRQDTYAPSPASSGPETLKSVGVKPKQAN